MSELVNVTIKDELCTQCESPSLVWHQCKNKTCPNKLGKKSNKKTMTINLPENEMKLLNDMALLHGHSKTTLVRQALRLLQIELNPYKKPTKYNQEDWNLEQQLDQGKDDE